MNPRSRNMRPTETFPSSPALERDLKKERIRRLRTEIDRKTEELGALQLSVNKMLKELRELTGQPDVSSHGE